MEFTKMQGAGNDFLLIDGFKYNLDEIVPKIKSLCDRRFGVGGDGIMVALPSTECDVKMYYYNSDGSQGEMCGNGIRCFAKFVYEKNIVKKDILKIETLAGVQTAVLNINDKGIVEKIEIEIGNIKYSPKDIVVNVEGENAFNKKLTIDGKEITFSSIFLGVPHTVIFIEHEGQYDVNDIGSKIEVNPIFPKKTNVNFVLPLSNNEIKIFTWERGAGRTLACGTGSSSAALLCHKLKGMDNTIKVYTEGGELEVQVLEDRVKLRGSAEITFEGTVDLKK
ncbi:diaminopimelate epimerase [Fusobacterium perfoetens]|uniref:diaminopimelate epimerase n=1 Tax=Fusobacterium perfoetens TaxID=852 RepID=UPI001F310218|nr:diaminopimelate epimerase [Fusobacterium perfoetens]MCF2624864.1 diaminopimelate epimerase [Fusobacterium perfoetens]